MAGAVSNLMVRAGFDGSQLTRGLQQMQGDLRGAQGSIGSTLGMVGKVTAAAVAAAGAALVTLGGYIAKTGVQYDALIEQSQIAWTTILGSANQAKDTIQQLQTMGAKTPFEFEGLDKSAKMLEMAGFKGKDLFNTLTKVGDAVSAVGGNDEVLNGVTLALFQMSTKGKISAQDMNQLAERGIPSWQLLADGMHKNVQEVMKLSEQGKLFAKDALPLMIDGMGNKFSGAMDKQSQTFNGMMSTLKDDFKMISAALAKPIFDNLKNGLSKLMPFLDGLTAWAQGKGLKSFTDTLTQTFGAPTSNKIMGFVVVFGKYLKQFKDGLETGKQGLIGFFNSAKDNLGGPLTNVFNSLKDIGGYAFNDLAKFAQNAFTQIRDFWQKDGDKIMAAVKQAIQDVSAALDASKPFLKAVFDIITTVGIKVFNDFVGVIKFVGNNLSWLGPIALGVVSAIGAFKIITGVIELIKNFTLVTQLLNKAWILLDIALDANPIGLIAIGIGALIAAGVLLYQNWDTVKNKMDVIWMQIKAGAQDAINAVIGKINEMINIIDKIPGVKIPLVPQVNLDVLSSVRAAPGTAPKGLGRAGGAVAAFASGTNYAPGGIALVGEQGPELVNLPRGSGVHTASETKQMLGGTSKTYNVTVNSLQASMDQKDLVRALQRMEALNV